MFKIIYKPWGREEWLELNDKYCYKRIYINSGFKTSFQYHKTKKETNYIISGKAEVWLENDQGEIIKKIMKDGDFFNVQPPQKHRIIALTDLILQEVSTPEVDDVVRIDDDFLRKDGKIEEEHLKRSVCILAAGKGVRLVDESRYINKAIIPVGNKAIISYLIEKFPKEYEIVIALGHKGDDIKDYCCLAYPDRKFVFVNVPVWEGLNSGPGFSLLACKEYLQNPFYLLTADCLFLDDVPNLYSNWVAYYPTNNPERYSTISMDNNFNFISIMDKSCDGGKNAFIGFAGIYDYKLFWEQPLHTEILSRFVPNRLICLKINWFDCGCLYGLNEARSHFEDKIKLLKKDKNEFFYYLGDRIIKICESEEIAKDKYYRGLVLQKNIPNNLKISGRCISYDYIEGKTLYEVNSVNKKISFLNHYANTIKGVSCSKNDVLAKDFYTNKTNERIKKLEKTYSFFGELRKTINIENIIKNLTEIAVKGASLYSDFHGDFHFGNIIYTNDYQFKYIDWRESFGGNNQMGDIYYDLGKLYAGLLVNFNLCKDDDNLIIEESEYFIPKEDDLVIKEFEELFRKDLQLIKCITALVYVNMAGLHSEKLAKILVRKALEIYNELKF